MTGYAVDVEVVVVGGGVVDTDFVVGPFFVNFVAASVKFVT